jgi:hypothetical protein
MVRRKALFSGGNAIAWGGSFFEFLIKHRVGVLMTVSFPFLYN